MCRSNQDHIWNLVKDFVLKKSNLFKGIRFNDIKFILREFVFNKYHLAKNFVLILFNA